MLRRLARCSLVLGTAALALAAAGSPVLAVEGGGSTTSLTGTLATPHTMTGAITLVDAAPATTYVVIHSFEALPAEGGGSSRIYAGAYRFTFSGCTGGTAAADGGPQVIGAGGAHPDRPPASSGAPTFTTAPGSTSMRCAYSVEFSGHAPPGPIDALRADLWVVRAGSVVAMDAGPAIPAPFPPPVAVPEAPSAALLPAAALALFGLALLLQRRRGGPSRRASDG